MLPDRPRIGKYILDSLSIGMYNHPLTLIREYIQNSTDAIDEYRRLYKPQRYDPKIEINIDGKLRTMTIRDNGAGIPATKAWNILHDLGNSNKRLNRDRGFRGIGRLGGLGYCDRLIFLTKYENEAIVTSSEWDCRQLRQLMRADNKYDTHDVLSAIINFDQNRYEGAKEAHYFEVKMIGLSSSRDMLLNIPLIRKYISEVAPVPFDKKVFSFADRVDQILRAKVQGYETYKIVINGVPIYKPYTDRIVLRGEHKDRISDINFFTLTTNNNSLGVGWIAETQLLGTLSTQSNAEGIRVRKDNILVGDKDFLSGFFRESRFNNYLAGEIHILDGHLIPNSRRDDFEDNAYKDDFYESFIKTIGLPVSKKIRQLSLNRNKEKNQNSNLTAIEQANQILREGYLAELQRTRVLKKLNELKKAGNSDDAYIDGLIRELQNSKHLLDSDRANGNKQHKAILKPIFEILFKEYDDKDHAIKIIRKIISTRINSRL